MATQRSNSEHEGKRRAFSRRRFLSGAAVGAGIAVSDLGSLTDLAYAAANSITLENSGDAPHTFTVGGTDLVVKVDPGGSDEVSFEVDPGISSVTCTFHPQMEATLTVG